MARKPPKVRISVAAKPCNGCGEVKSAGEFHANRLASDGLSYRCKPCARMAASKWYLANPERAAARRLTLNPLAVAASSARSKAKKPELYRLHSKAAWAAWRARVCGQTLQLAAGARSEIRGIYSEARRLTRQTGTPHEVDHIIPLKGEVVCGLHVPWNLQIITAEANRKKSNKVVL